MSLPPLIQQILVWCLCCAWIHSKRAWTGKCGEKKKADDVTEGWIKMNTSSQDWARLDCSTPSPTRPRAIELWWVEQGENWIPDSRRSNYHLITLHRITKPKSSPLFIYFNCFLFIEFIGMTLVNKIIQVSGAQFHNTSSVYCIACLPPKSSLLPPPFVSPKPSSASPYFFCPREPPHCCPWPWVLSHFNPHL